MLFASLLCVVLTAPSLALAHPREVESGPVTALRFLGLGIEHILTGYDHLLFLLALLLGRLSLRQLLGLVTCFSAAHSLTLVLVVLGVFRVSESVVEPAIAVTVIIVGLSTLANRAHTPRYALAFGLGLIHGCGFAGALADAGLPNEARWLALLAFNIGVELGQLLVLTCILPLLWALDRPRVSLLSRLVVMALGVGAALSIAGDDLVTAGVVLLLSVSLAVAVPIWGYQRVVIKAGSVTIALLGAIWLVFRVTGYSSYALELSLRRLWL